MKALFAILLLFVSCFSHANEPETPVSSKFGVCLFVATVSSAAYNLRIEKKKLRYPGSDDIIIAVLAKQGADYGYRIAASEYDAAYTANIRCLRSNLWSS